MVTVKAGTNFHRALPAYERPSPRIPAAFPTVKVRDLVRRVIHESRHHFGLDTGALDVQTRAGRGDGKPDPLKRDALKGHYS